MADDPLDDYKNIDDYKNMDVDELEWDRVG